MLNILQHKEEGATKAAALYVSCSLLTLTVGSDPVLIRASLARFLALTPAEVSALGELFDAILEHAGNLADALPTPAGATTSITFGS